MPPKGVKRHTLKVKKAGVMKAKRVESGEGSAGLRRGKTVEQIYQKKTPVEHILLRPDTYVGSVEKQDDNLWIWNNDKGEMDYRSITYVPALYKIFDEILVNSADNLQRDKSMTYIKVEIDTKQKRVKVTNNGKGLPIAIHKEHKVYVPELVFGHLLTSDNYDDSEKKVTGGRNGFGAKLTNIFSTRFIVETAGGGKRYSQKWTSNMSRKEKPDIKKYSGEPYTSVEFWPDLPKFGMSDLEEDTVALMRRRVYDVAGTSGDRCSVYLDGKKLAVKSFPDYANLFHSADTYVHTKIGKRWELVVAKNDDGEGFQHNSFVNAISTPKGGTHVAHVVDQLVDAIQAKAKKEAGKGTEIKPVHVKNQLWVFINCLIENPAFSSQTKEQMTLKASSFGSHCPINKALIDEIVEKTDVVSAVIAESQAKMTAQMDKMGKAGAKGKRVLGIPKLEDANDAGGKHASECTLILTEGDSAKALAVAGLGVVGRDRYGVFPLRGKLLNVRDVSQKQVAENKEIMSIVKILGLSFGQKGDQKKMRYGSVMIMADQDYDGSHIKGLLINFFHFWWPDLLKEGGFVREFVTPIVKCTKGPNTHTFFTQNEYEEWTKEHSGESGWQIKYYKGLGTSTAAEAKEYFKAMEEHRLDFEWKNAKDGELIDMAFSKSRADDRKMWMNNYKEGTFVDHSEATLTYQDFVNLELVQFSKYSVMRSVPSIMDGFKPTQRKVLFCCFKRNLRNDVKVAQLVGYVGEHSAYHHGEASLAGTIISMAQDFVGSNNLNLLVPSGQFGTRLQGGSDHASARYIYTRLAPVTRLIFSPLDDAVLNYLVEDGQKIEPTFYAPIIPMVLVNGASGIGTGWSTDIPNYDPLAIIANLRLFIGKQKMKPMRPWFRGFTGCIESLGKGSYYSWGKYWENDNGLEITELPLRRWTQDYKEFLQSMLPGADGKSKITVQDVREHHTEKKVHFSVKISQEELKNVKAAGVEHTFKLWSTINETNMVLFNSEGKIAKYKNVLDIMDEFAKVRLKHYDMRKKYLIDKLTLERDLLNNRARFIAMVCAKKLHINNRKKADVVKDLIRFKFMKFGDTKPPRTGFEYLLIMQIASLTKERKEELERMAKDKGAELEKVKRTSIQAMWLEDLKHLEAAILQLYAADEEEKDAKKGTKRKAADAKAPKRKGKANADEDAGNDEGGDDDAEAQIDPLDNPFGDISRWTAGALKAKTDAGGASKKRRTK
jgi:DNA topoisomerase-2